MLCLLFWFPFQKCGVIWNTFSSGNGVSSFLSTFLHMSFVELFDLEYDIWGLELTLVEWSRSSFNLLFLNLLFFSSMLLFLVLFSVKSDKIRLSSAFSSLIELIPKICFLFFGLVGFNNLGCSITRFDLLSEINFMLLNISFSRGLLGWAKKSSGNIFLVGILYFIILK